MSYTIGPNISSSAPLVGNQPLRGTWRRSATASTIEIVSGSLADTSLQQLFDKLDDRLPQAKMYRGSPPTFTEDTVTIDLVMVSQPSKGYNASQAAAILDQLVKGLPLVSLSGRVRRPGEEARAAERDQAAIAGQASAEAQSVSTWLGQLGSTAKLVLGGLVLIVVIAGAVYFLPRPTGTRNSE